MKKLFNILLLLPLAFFSCEKITNNCPDLITSNSISNFPMDLYGVNQVEVFYDELRINVNYGGGCEEHKFKLINDISTNDEGGQQINILYLSHNSNNDVCFAQITEHQLCFDISDINGDQVYFYHPDTTYDLN
tara:strand:- start:1915 stop:2313 length:399 start_codon:yes stop_codon:yes gene_type:complete